MQYFRQIKTEIEEKLFKNKVIIIYGARQVGKTTLVKEIVNKHLPNSLYLNCDELDIRQALSDKTSTELKSFIGQKKIVIIDEAQRVKNIGLTLKLIVDNYPEIQVIATGSSSFELSNKIIEPLTGRKYEFYLYPLSIMEIKPYFSAIELNRLLEKRMIMGMYPEIINTDDNESIKNLKNLTSSYLFKDIFQYQNIKNSELLEKLLQALALQVGSEVSYTEIASLLGIDKNTVINYVRILEQAFIIFRLSPLSRNLRNELKKMRKIYFYDNGIRNALINNFNPLSLRNDTGALWENFLISERLKRNHYSNNNVNTFFWRTHEQQEIDYIEEQNGTMQAFEFKWGNKTAKLPSLFINSYNVSAQTVVNGNNWQDFVVAK